MEVKKVGGITVTKKVKSPSTFTNCCSKTEIHICTKYNLAYFTMIQVGGKIELSTKTKASAQPPMPPGVENNTKTQIGRLTKTVSSSGKVTYI